MKKKFETSIEDLFYSEEEKIFYEKILTEGLENLLEKKTFNYKGLKYIKIEIWQTPDLMTKNIFFEIESEDSLEIRDRIFFNGDYCYLAVKPKEKYKIIVDYFSIDNNFSEIKTETDDDFKELEDY